MERLDGLDALEGLDGLGDVLAHMGSSLDGMDTLTENANKMVTDNTDAVAEALAKLGGIDFETLNQAIRDLADVVEPLARLTNFFNRGE